MNPSLTKQTFLTRVIYSRSPTSFLLSVFFTIFIQILTGIPKPDSLRRIRADEIIVQLSEELFDYPFWLQNLSHFPLFFMFSWLWARCLGPLSFSFYRLNSILLILITLSFAIFNELIQAFIPERFPSAGDLTMNLLGVCTALIVHMYLSKKFPAKCIN